MSVIQSCTASLDEIKELASSFQVNPVRRLTSKPIRYLTFSRSCDRLAPICEGGSLLGIALDEGIIMRIVFLANLRVIRRRLAKKPDPQSG